MKLHEAMEKAREMWKLLTMPYEEGENEDYLEACELVCEKCSFRKPEGSFCVMCPVECSRRKIVSKGADHEN